MDEEKFKKERRIFARREMKIRMPRRVSGQQIRAAMKHFESRAQASHIAEQLAKSRKSGEQQDSADWNTSASVDEHLKLCLALFQAGKLTWEEYFFQSVVAVEKFHYHLWLNGEYNRRLARTSERIEEIERKHGLAPGQYWRRAEGPHEHTQLTERYEEILDAEFLKLLKAFGLKSHARLWSIDKEEYSRLRECGRSTMFERDDVDLALTKLIETYENEIKKCVAAEAYYAACAMIGSSCEARILLKCEQNPKDVEGALKLVPKSKGFSRNGPRHWNLSQLVEIAKHCGWIADMQTKFVELYIVNALKNLGSTRNHIHPGRHISENPYISIGKEQYLDAIFSYRALCYALEQIDDQNNRKRDRNKPKKN